MSIQEGPNPEKQRAWPFLALDNVLLILALTLINGAQRARRPLLEPSTFSQDSGAPFGRFLIGVELALDATKVAATPTNRRPPAASAYEKGRTIARPSLDILPAHKPISHRILP